MFAMTIGLTAQGSRDFIIDIQVQSGKERAIHVLKDFDNYPEWTGLLEAKLRGPFAVGEKFDVTIHSKQGKPASFTAKMMRVEPYSFTARQVIGFGGFFKATHHFIIDEVDESNVRLVQHWELSGLLSVLFKKKIHEALSEFTRMNEDFKRYVEANPEMIKAENSDVD